MTDSEDRRANWRTTQKARRDRMKAKGKILVRLWCTPKEAQHIRQCVREFRRAQRLIEMRRRAAAHASEVR